MAGPAANSIGRAINRVAPIASPAPRAGNRPRRMASPLFRDRNLPRPISITRRQIANLIGPISITRRPIDHLVRPIRLPTGPFHQLLRRRPRPRQWRGRAGGSAHHGARKRAGFGHTVKRMAPQSVVPDSSLALRAPPTDEASTSEFPQGERHRLDQSPQGWRRSLPCKPSPIECLANQGAIRQGCSLTSLPSSSWNTGVTNRSRRN